MTIKSDNEDGQTRYVKRYTTDRWFTHIDHRGGAVGLEGPTPRS